MLARFYLLLRREDWGLSRNSETTSLLPPRHCIQRLGKEQSEFLQRLRKIPVIPPLWRKGRAFLRLLDEKLLRFSGGSSASLWDHIAQGSLQEKQQQDQFYPHTPQPLFTKLWLNSWGQGNFSVRMNSCCLRSCIHFQFLTPEHRGSLLLQPL